MLEVQPFLIPRRKRGGRRNLWWCLLKEKHSAPIQVDQVLGSSVSHYASTFFNQTGKNTDLLHWCKPFSKLLCCASLNKSTAAYLKLHALWFIHLMQWQLHRERPHATAQSFQEEYIRRVISAPLTPKSGVCPSNSKICPFLPSNHKICCHHWGSLQDQTFTKSAY